MCKAKKWSVRVGAILVLACAFELLLAGPPPPIDPKPPVDEHPWGSITGGASAGVVTQKAYAYFQIWLSPTGGFYLVRVSVPAANAPVARVSRSTEVKK